VQTSLTVQTSGGQRIRSDRSTALKEPWTKCNHEPRPQSSKVPSSQFSMLSPQFPVLNAQFSVQLSAKVSLSRIN